MREIKFRGYSRTFKRWLYGSLINNAFYTRLDGKANCQILDTDFIEYDCFEDIGQELHNLEVVPESVGQYTGLTDKNGVEIYEGDIVKKPYYSDRRRKINGEIKFIDGEFVTDFVDYDQSLRMATDIEVIGNIFYNPELVDSNA